jgi:hypothetical protein
MLGEGTVTGPDPGLLREVVESLPTDVSLSGDLGRPSIPSWSHRLAGRTRIAARELDGETLQTWSAPGDPYTDELVARLAGCGAHVQVAVATVIGGGGPPTLTDGQFALRPAGWPVAGAVALDLEAPGLELPLWVHWSVGAVEPSVDRLRDHLARRDPQPPA